MSDRHSEIAVLGCGMHPWGKWGKSFVNYGVVAIREALAEAGLHWRDIQMVCGASTMRNGYPGYVAGATFAEAMGWTGIEISSSYAACASGSQALQSARTAILSGACDVAVVVGADTTPKGFLTTASGYRPDDRDWVRFRMGITNPVYFGLYATRRMHQYGTTLEDMARVKVKNSTHGSKNPNARYKKIFTLEEVMNSAVVSSPLRLLDICATSDGGAAMILSSLEFARRHLGHAAPIRLAAVSTVTPEYPVGSVEMPYIATDSWHCADPQQFRPKIAHKAYKEAGMGPDEMSLAEVYDLSTAFELDWYEDLGFCEKGGAERLLNDGVTSLGGRLPVNPSGGLACFGEAVPAQAIAQSCEVYRQLAGQSQERQIDNPRAGICVNQGLFGHGSAIILAKN